MSPSETIEEFVKLLIEGQPMNVEWMSIKENYERRYEYEERLSRLRKEIDEMILRSAP